MRSFKSASAGNDGDAFHGAGYGLKKAATLSKEKGDTMSSSIPEIKYLKIKEPAP